MKPTRPRLLAFGTLMALAAAAAAQAPPDPASAASYVERVDVERVTVDVWVSDARGEPVTGLAADSFQVLHDGQPARITSFTEVRGGVAAEPAATATRPATGFLPIPVPPGHTVVYFDQTRIHPSRYATLIASLKKHLQREAVASDRVLILSQNRGLSVEASFGSSRRELEEALDRLAGGSPGGMDLETETRLALEAIRDAWDHVQDTVGSALDGLAAVPTGQPGGVPGTNTSAGPRAVVGGAGSGTGPDACGMFVTQIEPTLGAWAQSYGQRAAVTLTNLASTAGFLAGLPGVKTLLYLGDGLQMRPGSDLATYASSLCPAAGAELLSTRLEEQFSEGFRNLTRHANANRVTIYSLQTSGITALGDSADASAGRGPRGGTGPKARSSFEAAKRSADREGLQLIASETGGRAVFSQSDLAPELARIDQEMRHYYALAYEPPAGTTGGERREHRIEVRIGDGKLTTRYRRGYVEKDATQWLTERIEGALNLGLTSNPLQVRLGAGTVQAAGEGSYRIPLHVMVPVERLAFLPRQEMLLADVTLRIMVRPVDGATMVIEDHTFQIQGAPGATGLADLAVALELAAGTHVTAIGLRDANTGEASFVSTTLQVGAGG